jgi:translation initiation factor IF-1
MDKLWTAEPAHTEDETKSTVRNQGVIDEVLPNAMFRVRLDDGRAVRAGVAQSLRHGIVRLIGGSRVEVKIASQDPNRAQIVKKL